MVKQITGQSIQNEPASLGVSGYHETRFSILNRLENGQAKSVSKLQDMKKSGLSGGNLIGGGLVGGNLIGGGLVGGQLVGTTARHTQDRSLENIMADKTLRKVEPFTGGSDSPFLNFSSGRSTKGENKTLNLDTLQGEAMVHVNTGFNRY